MKHEILASADELISAVLNGVYQGIVLTLLVYVVLRLLGRTNAATRYCAWAATLLLVVGIIPAHYWRHRLFTVASRNNAGSRAQLPSAVREPTITEGWAPATADLAEPMLVNQDLSSNQDNNETTEIDNLCGDPLPVSTTIANPSDLITSHDGVKDQAGFEESPMVQKASLTVIQESNSSEASNQTSHWSWDQIVNPISWNISSFTNLPKTASLGLLAAWAAIALFRAGRLAGRLYQLGKIKKAALLPSAELVRAFARLCADLGVRRQVEVKVCPVNASPVALGFFHPVILLPEGHAGAPEVPETEHILRHELAHVYRRDDWANLAQNFVQAALFFHPAVWWISKRLSLEREIACDDQVLQHGAGARAYALLLAELAGRLKRNELVFAQGVSSSKSQLQQRINMILNTRRNTSPGLAKVRLGFVTSTAALLAVLALYFAPRLVLAQSPTASAAVAATTPPAAGAVVFAPGTVPVAIIASADEPDATPAPAAPPGVGAGPKFKDGPAAALPPVPPAPAVDVHPAPLPVPSIAIAADVHPMGLPHPPGHPGKPSPDGSLEERLERLEQMVHSLMAQQGIKRHGAIILRDGHEAGMLDEKQMEKMNERINEMAKKQAQRAEEQAKRAAEMAERANKDFNFKWKAEAEHWGKGKGKEGLEKQLDALRKAREGLERQMEDLDRQIERVERDQERIQEEQERRSELQQEESKEEASVAEVEENVEENN